MKKFLLKALLIGLYSTISLHLANAQTIDLVRTDVDSTRSDFVTATYLFAFDLKVNDLDNCNNASLLLKFNNINHVKFSSIRIGDFGEEGTLIYDVRDIGGETYISIGVFSGEGLQENEYDSPTLCNLEFVVKPTAPDNENVTFSFVNAFGAEFLSEIEDGSATPLTTSPVTYDIHGFVDVWPGDTDRDSDVDNVDWTTIYVNLDFGDRFPGYRSFKRDKASTNFYPQRALVWDEESGTYADCDGDGHISITDAQVVVTNLYNVSSGIRHKGSIEKQSEIDFSPKLQDETTIAIPINVEHVEDFYGVTGEITFQEDNFEIVGLEAGELFIPSEHGIMQDKHENSIEFIASTFDESIITTSGEIAKLIIRPTDDSFNPNYQINKLKAITSQKRIIELTSITSVIPEKKNFFISQQSNNIIINSEMVTRIKTVSLYDTRGNQVYTINNNSLPLNILETKFASGFYLLQIESDKVKETHPIVINK